MVPNRTANRGKDVARRERTELAIRPSESETERYEFAKLAIDVPRLEPLEVRNFVNWGSVFIGPEES
ncbi:unnamed protein product [Linum trigynum]|uniref:Uncharacterized protein n=1 Tax=Linum trigynum TaxID=586398 RepID=A0AAV2G4X1_9ROSI